MPDSSDQRLAKLVEYCLPKQENCLNVVYAALMKTWPETTGYSRSKIEADTNSSDDWLNQPTEGSVLAKAPYSPAIESGTSFRPPIGRPADEKPPIKKANRQFPHFTKAVDVLKEVAGTNAKSLVFPKEQLLNTFLGEVSEAEYLERYGIEELPPTQPGRPYVRPSRAGQKRKRK